MEKGMSGLFDPVRLGQVRIAINSKRRNPMSIISLFWILDEKKKFKGKVYSR